MEIIIKFILNNQIISTSSKPQSSLLDFIRNEMHLTGTKEVCREGDCGACTVLIGELIDGKLKYHSVNSCIYPLGNVANAHVVTIEGLSNNELSFVQKEFAENQASQCGFCTPGFINSFTGYLINSDSPNNKNAKNAIAGNICRCTGYGSILRAVHSAISELEGNSYSNDIDILISKNIIPEYFSEIENKLIKLKESNNKNIITNDIDIIVGGGTDLLVQKEEYLQTKNISLAFQNVQSGIFEDDKSIHIYASSTFEDLKNSTVLNNYFPKLSDQLNLVASLPIRNSATVAGNLVNASPIADMSIILLALDATVVYYVGNDSFTMKLRDFYSGYKQLNIPKNSSITEIIFDKPTDNYYFNFEKVSKRTYLDIASVNSAILISLSNGDVIENISISAGGVSPIPLYLKNASEYLIGKRMNIENINQSLEIIENEISPISDVRGSKEYKTLLLKQLVKAHFIELFPNQFSVGDLL